MTPLWNANTTCDDKARQHSSCESITIPPYSCPITIKINNTAVPFHSNLLLSVTSASFALALKLVVASAVEESASLSKNVSKFVRNDLIFLRALRILCSTWWWLGDSDSWVHQTWGTRGRILGTDGTLIQNESTPAVEEFNGWEKNMHILTK